MGREGDSKNCRMFSVCERSRVNQLTQAIFSVVDVIGGKGIYMMLTDDNVRSRCFEKRGGKKEGHGF